MLMIPFTDATQFLESQRRGDTEASMNASPEAFYNALNHQGQIAHKQVTSSQLLCYPEILA